MDHAKPTRGWQRSTACLVFIGHFPQKSPIISSSLAKNDLQLKASYGSSPSCSMVHSPQKWPIHISKVAHIDYQKRPICIIKRELYTLSKETYIHYQKRPIYIIKRDLYILLKETYIHHWTTPCVDYIDHFWGLCADGFSKPTRMARTTYLFGWRLFPEESCMQKKKRPVYIIKWDQLHYQKRPVTLSRETFSRRHAQRKYHVKAVVCVAVCVAAWFMCCSVCCGVCCSDMVLSVPSQIDAFSKVVAESTVSNNSLFRKRPALCRKKNVFSKSRCWNHHIKKVYSFEYNFFFGVFFAVFFPRTSHADGSSSADCIAHCNTRCNTHNVSADFEDFF